MSRKPLLVVLALAVALTACGGVVGKVNGSKKFKSKWSAQLTPFTGDRRKLELELWVNGNRFRIHQKEDVSVNPGYSSEVDTVETDLVYDGKTLWEFNRKSTPKNYSGEVQQDDEVLKMEPLADQMAGITFWKIPDSLPLADDGQESVGGVNCKRFVSRQRSALGVDMVFRFWVDEGRGVLIKRGVGQGTDSSGGTDAVLGTSFTCNEIDLAPSFQDQDFKFDPGSKTVETMERPPFHAL